MQSQLTPKALESDAPESDTLRIVQAYYPSNYFTQLTRSRSDETKCVTERTKGIIFVIKNRSMIGFQAEKVRVEQVRKAFSIATVQETPLYILMVLAAKPVMKRTDYPGRA